MSNYFLASVNYFKVLESGERIVTEQYVINAVNLTECETKIIEEIPEASVISARRSNITEVINASTDGWFYDCSVGLISLDEKTMKEKRITLHYLVVAESLDDAKKHLELHFKNTALNYVLSKIAETKVLGLIE